MDIDMQLAIITIALTLTSCVFLVISVASHIDVYIDDRLMLIRLITGILLLVLCITYYHVANYYIDYYEPEANINFTNIEKNIKSETNVDVEMGASIKYNGNTHTNDIIVPTDTTFDQLLSIIKYTQQYINYNQYIEEQSSNDYTFSVYLLKAIQSFFYILEKEELPRILMINEDIPIYDKYGNYLYTNVTYSYLSYKTIIMINTDNISKEQLVELTEKSNVHIYE